MIKSLRYKSKHWNTILERIKSRYPKRVWLIRDNLRKTLGFLPCDDYRNGQHIVRLDFYDEGKRTMFLLQFSDVPVEDRGIFVKVKRDITIDIDTA